MKCPECGNQMTVTREDIRDTFSGLPNLTLKNVEIRRCACGEEIEVIRKVEDLHKAIAHCIINRAGRLTGPEIKFLRKHIGWSGVDFARHFGVTPSTVSRWEHEEEPIGGTADRLLRLVVACGNQVKEYPLETLAKVAQPEAAHDELQMACKRDHWEMVTA